MELYWDHLYIYKITNLLNNKIYVGQHKTNKLDDKYFGGGLILNKSINKNGRENFKKEIIEFCETWDHLNEREIYWIEKLDARNPEVGYNLCKGGRGGCARGIMNPMFGKSLPRETAEKISKKLKGHKRTEEAKEKQSQTIKANGGMHLSQEVRDKISKSHKGKKQSKEHLEALSKVRKGKQSPMKGRTQSEESKMKNRLAHLGKQPPNSKKVDIFTLNNEFITTYDSLNICCKQLNLTHACVRKFCNNEINSYRNLIFKWHNS